MQVIGFNFEKISAEKKKGVEGKIQISSNIQIKSIKKENISIVKDKPTLKIDFEFKIDYKPNLAEINLQGVVLVTVEKDESKAILKKWKNKKIDEDVRIPLFNIILTKSNLRALQLEEELNLPTHIPLPRIRPQSDQNPNKTYAS